MFATIRAAIHDETPDAMAIGTEVIVDIVSLIENAYVVGCAPFLPRCDLGSTSLPTAIERWVVRVCELSGH